MFVKYARASLAWELDPSVRVWQSEPEGPMPTNEGDEGMVGGGTTTSVIFVAVVVVVALAVGAWLFGRLEVPSLRDASRAPTTVPVPKDPNVVPVPKSTELAPQRRN